MQSITTTKHVKEADVRQDGSSEETPEVLSETQVEVFYIDFGDMEWVSSSEIRLLLPRFKKLPGQVVKCSLANIEPYVEHSFETGKRNYRLVVDTPFHYCRLFAITFLLGAKLSIFE